jgi:hypothetical protein
MAPDYNRSASVSVQGRHGPGGSFTRVKPAGVGRNRGAGGDCTPGFGIVETFQKPADFARVSGIPAWGQARFSKIHRIILAKLDRNVYNMRMFRSNKTSVIGIIIACLCILVYLGVTVYVIIGINTNMSQRRDLAEQEFYDIADLASSAGLLSFMDDTFNDIIRDALKRCTALEGVIISGPNGEEGFEKEQGSALIWVNNSPRFRNRFDFSRQQLYRPLQIQGLRNVNIRAVAGAFDYADLSGILKRALLPVVISLAVAFFTILIGSLRGKQGMTEKQKEKKAETVKEKEKEKEKPDARSGYSERGRCVRQENTESRLSEELRRCAEAGQDLSFIAMEFKLEMDDSS